MNLGVKLTPGPGRTFRRPRCIYWAEFDHRRRDAALRIILQRDVNVIPRVIQIIQ